MEWSAALNSHTNSHMSGSPWLSKSAASPLRRRCSRRSSAPRSEVLLRGFRSPLPPAPALVFQSLPGLARGRRLWAHEDPPASCRAGPLTTAGSPSIALRQAAAPICPDPQAAAERVPPRPLFGYPLRWHLPQLVVSKLEALPADLLSPSWYERHDSLHVAEQNIHIAAPGACWKASPELLLGAVGSVVWVWCGLRRASHGSM